MSLRPRPRIKRLARGGYALNLPQDERALLRELPRQLIAGLEAVESGESVSDGVRRILPTAHPTDLDREANFIAKHRTELLAQHMEALDLVASTADSSRLNESELEGWLVATADLRLALGVMLGVTEQEHELDADAPDYADWICYHYLSFLQNEIIEVLTAELPSARPGAGDDLPEDPWGEPLGGLRWDGTPVPET
jgi:hypothetical protein